MKQKTDSNWIWIKEKKEENAEQPFIVLFRKNLSLFANPGKANVEISADSRYKLYVNGQMVEAGPSKGDDQIWFVDEIDITSYLKKGDNVIGVIVLRFPQGIYHGNQSIMSTPFPGLYFVGTVEDEEGEQYCISADDSWRYKINSRVKFVPESQRFAPLYFYEEAYADSQLNGWMSAGYDTYQWKTAVPYPKQSIRRAVSPGNLYKRTIPFMFRAKRRFLQISHIIKSASNHEKWERFLAGKEKITVGAGNEEIVEIDAGEEMTGYLRISVKGGRASKIEILQSEAYVMDCRGDIPVKQDRLDWINGHLEGYTDIYYPNAAENDGVLQIFEPFWFRTFRFIRLHIVCGDTPLTLCDFTYEETGYPLKIQTKVKTSDKSLDAVWDISERSLRRCMHETYEDCPFYEQLQYVMDSRDQILYTYACSADDRLARKCIDDFRRSQRYDGLLPSAYPNTRPNVIPGFSIYYILMLYDHMMYFGDKTLIRKHMPTVENILSFFEEHMTEQGYVGKLGDIHGKDRYWSFIDWVPDWISGVPRAGSQGSLTMESLLYLLGLKTAAELAVYAGRQELSKEYEQQAEKLSHAIRKYCIGPDGMVQDGPGFDEYSQHCQVFGILTGVLTKDEGRKNLLRTIQNKEKNAQCTVAMAFYLFRALEQTELYNYTDIYWEKWRKMVRSNMTTCAESDDHPRSECHAWGALALYEFPAVILGVRPAAPGFEKVRIHPVTGYLNWAQGNAVTPKGSVKVTWKKVKDTLLLDYEVPEGMVMEEEGSTI